MTDEQAEPFVQSLARGLSVIRSFDAEHPRLSLSEVAARTGLSRATARRFLLTLVELGYVRSEARSFELSPRVLELGFSYLSALTLPELAQPELEMLSREVGESTSASVLDGGQIVYIARVPTRRIMNVSITIGTRFPAHATSMGRVLLAGLPDDELDGYLATLVAEPLTVRTVTDPVAVRATIAQVRTQGWALVDQELELGVRSIAAPLTAPGGGVIAAINVSSTVAAASAEQFRDLALPHLLRAAAAITRAIALSRGAA